MSLIENVVPYTIGLTPEYESKIASLPKGVVGIASAFLGRYREFDACLNSVWLPPASVKQWCLGVDPCHHFNDMCRKVLSDKDLQWVWILGDDHVFTQDLWLNLYERNVDIVVPLCLRRSGFTPVLNEGEDKGFAAIQDSWKYLSGKKGLIEWPGVCGNAGMLIRRNVLEAMEPPWFRAGQLNPEFSASDLFFCHLAQKSGFKIHVDLDNHIGHINHTAIWPRRDEAGEWFVDTRSL